MARKKLGEILIQAGVLDQSGLRAALGEQRRWGGHLGRILVDMRLVSEDSLVQALSQQLKFPVVDVASAQIPAEVLELVPADLAERHAMIPFAVEGKFLDVAMTDPTNLGVIDELRIRTQLNVRPHLAGPKSVEHALARHYSRGRAALPFDNTNPRSPQNVTASDFHDSVDVIDLNNVSDRRPAAELSAAQMRAQGMELGRQQPGTDSEEIELRNAEVATLQARIQKLEQLIERDENVLRKVLVLLIDKGIATREEILERIK